MKLILVVCSFLLLSQGLIAQASLIKDINTGVNSAFAYDVDDFVGFGNDVYFVAKDNSTGYELWKSNGTSQGTVLLKDINAGELSSTPRHLTVMGNKLFFTASTAAEGRELWVTDGTELGTKMVKNINVGTSDAIRENAPPMVVYKDALYFAANNGTNRGQLWKSNGTDTGTIMVKDLGIFSSAIDKLTLFQNKIFFFEYNTLYASDGTDTGTVKIKILSNIPEFYVTKTYVYKDRLYMGLGRGYYGTEPWVSDGTDAGTKQLKDIVPGDIDGSIPENFYGFKDYVYFDGSGMWRTDGTPVGTTRVISNSLRTSQGDRINFVDNGSKMFFAALTGSFNKDLCITDGTVAGTKILRYLNGEVLGSDPRWFTLVNGKVYFSASGNSLGRELWVTDGTSLGTVVAADIVPGGNESSPQNLFYWNGNLYFTAYTSTNGRELWKLTITTPTKELQETTDLFQLLQNPIQDEITRSEERRVGKECA